MARAEQRNTLQRQTLLCTLRLTFSNHIKDLQKLNRVHGQNGKSIDKGTGSSPKSGDISEVETEVVGVNPMNSALGLKSGALSPCGAELVATDQQSSHNGASSPCEAGCSANSDPQVYATFAV